MERILALVVELFLIGEIIRNKQGQVIFIPPKDTEHCVMNVLNTYTEEKLGQIDNIQNVDITVNRDMSYARDELGRNLLSFTCDEPSYEMTFNADKPIDKKEFYKILGVDIAKTPDAYDIQFVKFVQARKHKKRRINKKWLKRYGYKQMIVESKGWKIKCNMNGNIEFVK